jgi:hypothetical protein
MKGYKVFNPDFTCRGFQYEVGKTYEEDVVPDVCEVGFHFCQKLTDCFSYYDFNPNNKVAEIEAIGDIDEGDNKCCTNKITIIQEITWQEVFEMVNTGKGDTGLCNSGDLNSGDWNSGDCNSGNLNSGNWNSGDCNSGNWNSGNWNSGDCNSGNWNSGDWNSGDCNSGNWNKTSFSAGVFCTEQSKLIMFNKPTEITFDQWRCSDACRLLNRIDFRPTEFIWSDDMTDEEKATHPEWETTEGYLKKLDTSECCHDWWMNLSMEEKCAIKNMPNFDAGIFKEITGIQV